MVPMNKDFNKELAKVLIRAGCLEGVECSRNIEDEIAIVGGHLDDYLLVTYLGQLIERGEMEIKMEPNRIDYAYKLLKIDEG